MLADGQRVVCILLLQDLVGQHHAGRFASYFTAPGAALVYLPEVEDIKVLSSYTDEVQLVADHTPDEDHADLLQVVTDFGLLLGG